MKKLTPRQSDVLNAIVDYKDRLGFPPTMLELAGLIGCTSANAAAEHVNALKKKGYISVARGAARAITVNNAQPKRITLTMNTLVKVKLFDPAMDEIKRLHDELRKEHPQIKGVFVPPLVDEDGYTTMPLWAVMSDFGGLCYPGATLPFELAVDLEGK
ncbi:SOS-response repressor and protease LexA [Scandinavium sp. H11S7]|uniref:LexA family protein n=1 Tax=Scandinavium hiltneri TaxID=2926519 RepID=UPI0021662C2E|nr:SOS-response repressor and protease LexA [Scandinavium hiltneri]MCS2155493.1 SOS-response repressor and protease LexA [Scandinavium hiltneri]